MGVLNFFHSPSCQWRPSLSTILDSLVQNVIQSSSPFFCPILTPDSCILTSLFFPILDTSSAQCVWEVWEDWEDWVVFSGSPLFSLSTPATADSPHFGHSGHQSCITFFMGIIGLMGVWTSSTVRFVRGVRFCPISPIDFMYLHKIVVLSIKNMYIIYNKYIMI